MPTQENSDNEEVTFVEFRRKVRSAEVLSSAMERLLQSLQFSGRVSVVVQNGRVLKSGYEEGYFPVAPTDSLQDVRTEMVRIMEQVGIQVEKQHHEVATAGQAEIDQREIRLRGHHLLETVAAVASATAGYSSTSGKSLKNGSAAAARSPNTSAAWPR